MMATEEQEVQINGVVHFEEEFEFGGADYSQTSIANIVNTAVSMERLTTPSPDVNTKVDEGTSVYSSESIILKAELNGDIRRTYLNNTELTYDDLVRRLERLFKELNESDNLVIKYKDEEGDFVTIESNVELSFAIQTCKGLNLKISRKQVSTEKTLASELKQELLEIRNRVDKIVEKLEIGEVDNDIGLRKRSENNSYSIPVKELAYPPKQVTQATQVTPAPVVMKEFSAPAPIVQNKMSNITDALNSAAIAAKLQTPTTGTQFPTIGSQIPPVGSPIPTGGSQIPPVGSPFPAGGSQIPPVGSPFPAGGSQIPPLGSPFPAGGSQIPPVGSPFLVTVSQIPPGGSPFSTAGSQTTPGGSPFPTAGSQIPPGGSQFPPAGNQFQSVGSQLQAAVSSAPPLPTANDQAGVKPPTPYNFTPAMGLPSTYPGAPAAPTSETATPPVQAAQTPNMGQQVPYSRSSSSYYGGSFSTQPAPYPSMGPSNYNKNLNQTTSVGYGAMSVPSGTQVSQNPGYPGGQMPSHQTLPDTGLYSGAAPNQQHQQQPSVNQGPPPIRPSAQLPPPPGAGVSAGGAFNPYSRQRSGLQ